MSTLKQELAKFIALEGKYELFLQSNNCEAKFNTDYTSMQG